METLEKLKAIYDGAPYENIGEEIFINTHGNYILFYEDDFYTRDNGKWVKCCGFLPCYGLRSLSDIKLIIELMERVAKGEPVKEECKHDDCITHWDHHQCKSCGFVLTDGGFGCASRKWFQNIEAAKFYQKNGFLPT